MLLVAPRSVTSADPRRVNSSAGRGGDPAEKTVAALIAAARRTALEARLAALAESDDREKREWSKIAATWDEVVQRNERVLADLMLKRPDAVQPEHADHSRSK